MHIRHAFSYFLYAPMLSQIVFIAGKQRHHQE